MQQQLLLATTPASSPTVYHTGILETIGDNGIPSVWGYYQTNWGVYSNVSGTDIINLGYDGGQTNTIVGFDAPYQPGGATTVQVTINGITDTGYWNGTYLWYEVVGDPWSIVANDGVNVMWNVTITS